MATADDVGTSRDGATAGRRVAGRRAPAAARGASGAAIVRVGFVPLVDAAPLIVACEFGYFVDEGLTVQLERQIGWGNVRDKLTFGHLHASHALLGIPPASVLGLNTHSEPLVSVMALGGGGDAITLSRRLAAAGVNSAATLAQYLRQEAGRPRAGAGDDGDADDGSDGGSPVFGHVFGGSMHHYLLRDWLAGAGLNADADVRLCVLPPSHMPGHMEAGHLDGFCVGEPWNTAAQRRGCGRVTVLTTDILPSHPDKVLAVTRAWATAHGEALRALIRALLRACAWCEDAGNGDALAAMLADARYLATDVETIRASLALDRTFGLGPAVRHVRPADWRMRSWAPAATFPSRTHVAWLVEQMRRWGHCDADVDARAVAMACTDASVYRQAASGLGIACPPDDEPPMPARGGGWFRVAPGGGEPRVTLGPRPTAVTVAAQTTGSRT